ncbi:MAG: hypothetical protein AB7Y46_04935 [Armatimonadota bacterium]
MQCLRELDEGELLPPLLESASGVQPLDFGWLLAGLRENFTGREWLDAQIDRWLRGSTRPGLVIFGEPGVGNSAIAA